MKKIAVRSYAKINICLDIKERRDDGYHVLDMIMVPVELHDTILLTELSKGTDNFVTIDDFSVAPIKYNLATFAIDTLAAKYHFNNKFRVEIHKVIPMQAGLGGGSSNAAFTLKSVNKYLKLGLSDEELIEIGTKLGADVPFFIRCKPMRCQGIGEEMTPVTIKNDYYCLLVKPNAGCSTADVYKKADEMTLVTGNVDTVVKALEEGDDDLLADSIFNVLQEPALEIVPDIKRIIDKLKELGFKIVQMSGSGSAVFALSTDKKLVKKAFHALENEHFVEITRLIK